LVMDDSAERREEAQGAEKPVFLRIGDGAAQLALGEVLRVLQLRKTTNALKKKHRDLRYQRLKWGRRKEDKGYLDPLTPEGATFLKERDEKGQITA